MSQLDDYIKTLTPEEREQHKDLIEESLEREKKLSKISEESEKNIMEMMRMSANLNSGLEDLSKRANVVKDRINELLLQLQNPESESYH